LDRYDLTSDEDLTAAAVVRIGTLEESKPYFCIGTADFTQGDQLEATKGRIIIFDTSGQKLSLVSSVGVNGCVFALASIQGLIAAAVNSAASDSERVLCLFLLKASPGSSISNGVGWTHVP
jgi:DNA damage-binding protein 1